MYRSEELKAIDAGKKLGNAIFGLLLKVDIDDETDSPHIAYYNPILNNVTIYNKSIIRYVNEGVDLFKLIEHTVAHEFGHAKEEKMFAQHRIYPWLFKLAYDCYVKANGNEIRGKQLECGIYQLIVCIHDFAIDTKLSEYSKKDQIAKIKVHEMETLQEMPLGLRQLDVVFNLPFYLGHYTYGDILQHEKDRVKDIVISIIGTSLWDKAIELLYNRSFGDISAYKKLITSYFGNFLHLKVVFENIPKGALGNLSA